MPPLEEDNAQDAEDSAQDAEFLVASTGAQNRNDSENPNIPEVDIECGSESEEQQQQKQIQPRLLPENVIKERGQRSREEHKEQLQEIPVPKRRLSLPLAAKRDKTPSREFLERQVQDLSVHNRALSLQLATKPEKTPPREFLEHLFLRLSTMSEMSESREFLEQQIEDLSQHSKDLSQNVRKLFLRLSTGSEKTASREFLERKVEDLSQHNKDLSDNNRALSLQLETKLKKTASRKILEQRVKNLEENDVSPRLEVAAELIAGVIGWLPPLWFIFNCNDGNILRQSSGDEGESIDDDSKDPSTSDDSVPCSIKKIGAGMKLIFCFSIFILNFTRVIVDTSVSIIETLGLESNNSTDNTRFRMWGIWLFLVTYVGRIMSGIFAVLYKHIDKSDRWTSFFIVEWTIFFVQDMAAYHVMNKKWMYNDRSDDTVTRLEWAIQDVTYYKLYLLLFVGFFHLKHIATRLPPFVSRVFLTLHIALVTWAVAYALKIKEYMENLSDDRYDLASRLAYSICVSIQLFILYHWSCYLYRNHMRKQLQQNSQENVDLEAGEANTGTETESSSSQ